MYVAQCMCVCAHQCMYVHAFVLIIRLHWPLRWHHSLWIVNTEQIKILFKSLPRKLALREREARTLDHYCLLSPRRCFLFSPVSECSLHVYISTPRLFVSTPMPFLCNGYYLKIRKMYTTSTGDKYFSFFFWEMAFFPPWIPFGYELTSALYFQCCFYADFPVIITLETSRGKTCEGEGRARASMKLVQGHGTQLFKTMVYSKAKLRLDWAVCLKNNTFVSFGRYTSHYAFLSALQTEQLEQ